MTVRLQRDWDKEGIEKKEACTRMEREIEIKIEGEGVRERE